MKPISFISCAASVATRPPRLSENTALFEASNAEQIRTRLYARSPFPHGNLYRPRFVHRVFKPSHYPRSRSVFLFLYSRRKQPGSRAAILPLTAGIGLQTALSSCLPSRLARPRFPLPDCSVSSFSRIRAYQYSMIYFLFLRIYFILTCCTVCQARRCSQIFSLSCVTISR